MLRPLTVLIAVVASATLAGCGTSRTHPPGTTAPSSGTAVAGATVAPAPTPPASGPDVLMIIRHGEKPDGEEPGLDAAGAQDDSSLTTVGWQRAHALVGLFDPAQGDPRAGLARPDDDLRRGCDRRRRRSADAGDRRPARRGSRHPGRHRVRQGRRGQARREDPRAAGTDADLLAARRDPRHRRGAHERVTGTAGEWPSERFDVVWTFTRTADGWHFAQTPELVLPQDHDGVIEN